MNGKISGLITMARTAAQISYFDGNFFWKGMRFAVFILSFQKCSLFNFKPPKLFI